MRVDSHMAGVTELVARRAVIVYEGGPHALASLHDVAVPKEGPPVILAGRCLAREALSDMLKRLQGGAAQRELLPANVLLHDAGRLLWHTPASRRAIFFSTGNVAFDKAVNGKHVLHPPLLFCAEAGSLYVFALASDERPTAETSVYRAPYYNLYASGLMCRGNAKLPDVAIPSEIAAWERAFFETQFTHSNLALYGSRQKLTAHTEGHDGLWRSLLPSAAGRKRSQKAQDGQEVFPGEYLVPVGLTVQQIADGKWDKAL